MKRIILAVLLNMISIAIATRFLPGLHYDGGLKTLVITSVILSAANILVKPIIKLLTLPIELVTLGLFGILVNAGMLYLTSLIFPQFSIQGFYFSGIQTNWFAINPTSIPPWGTAVIAASITGLITGTINWLID